MEVHHHRLEFKRPSGTSRGVLRTKDCWFLQSADGGIGEVSIISGLSRRSFDDYQSVFSEDDWLGKTDLSEYPALRFALEMVQLGDAGGDPFQLYDTSFVKGAQAIPINGLIWMGTKEYMYEQIKQKLEEGYDCLKLKIGAIDFVSELELLAYVREQFGPDDVELRVDANGAFDPGDAYEKLSCLSEYHLHSIEQPIKPNQIEEMAALCAKSPIDIALDEELIVPRYDHEAKRDLLSQVQPQYIILKPSLIGGLAQADDWISIAKELKIGWWATSALESNVGLNTTAQWVSQYDTDMPQGLGTGQLYTNNIPSPLTLSNGHISYDPMRTWDLSLFE